MNAIVTLTKRNMKLFLRDRMAVFFSFMSSIILVLLYFLFIARIYTSEMDVSASGGIALPIGMDMKNFIVYLQMIAGVLVLNSMSLSTGAFSTIARDFEQGRVDSLLLTPVKTHGMITSYFATGFISSFALNALTWLASYAIIGVVTGYWLAAGAFLSVTAILFAASLISCSIMLLITTLVKSSTAIGVLSGISGTFVGFLSGIYMPYDQLGETTKAVGSFLPFTHINIWLKQVVLGDAFSQAGIEGEFKAVLLANHFSADGVGFCGLDVPLWTTLVFSGVLGLICLVASYVLLRRRIKGKLK